MILYNLTIDYFNHKYMDCHIIYIHIFFFSYNYKIKKYIIIKLLLIKDVLFLIFLRYMV